MLLSSIHVIVCTGGFFHLLNCISIAWIFYLPIFYLSIHHLMDMWTISLLAIMNNANINIHVKIFISLRYVPRSKISGS